MGVMKLEAVDSNAFRCSMRRFASRVCVITTGGPCPSGMTATSVCSLSTEPASILVALNNGAKTTKAIIENGSFALNVLFSGQGCLAKLFSSDALRLSKTLYLTRKTIVGVTGVPLIRGTCATMECRVDEVMARGSHSIIIGRVVSTSDRNLNPLLYHDGSYGSFSNAEFKTTPPVRAAKLQSDLGFSCG